jgi:hypothetical protein
MLSEQSNKGSPHFRGGETTAFQRKAAKIEPNPRATRAWQRRTIKEIYVKKIDCILCRSIGWLFAAIGQDLL